NMTGILTAGIAALLFATAPAGAADEQGSIQGVVNDATGKPVAGAFVKLKNDARRLTYMVVTQTQGQFEAKDLPPGQYRVQAVGGGRQSERSTNVGVTAGGAAKVGLPPSTERGPMLPPAWPQRVPQAQANTVALELPNGDGKELVAEKCTSCHDLRRTV